MKPRIVATLVAFLAGSLAAPAGAHVTIAPATIMGGGVAELTFRCPNERPNAATVGLVVQLPADVPLRLVKARPVPGWQITVTMRKLARPIHGKRGDITTTVDTIAWTGGRIAPDEYQDFQILAGPLPHGPAKIVFKAVQTYADGETVRWIQVGNPGEPTPPLPAPILIIH